MADGGRVRQVAGSAQPIVMHSLTDKQERIIRDWANDERAIEMVRLYGSPAKGCARPFSDVDLPSPRARR